MTNALPLLDTHRKKLSIDLGQIIITQAVQDQLLSNDDFVEFYHASFNRHCIGDWGDLSNSDRQLNLNGMNPDNPGQLLSAYCLPTALARQINESKLWVITERDRSQTFILFRREYN